VGSAGHVRRGRAVGRERGELEAGILLADDAALGSARLRRLWIEATARAHDLPGRATARARGTSRVLGSVRGWDDPRGQEPAPLIYEPNDKHKKPWQRGRRGSL